MKAIGSRYKLSKIQVEYLLHIFSKNKIQNPLEFIEDTTALENLFETTFLELESNVSPSRNSERQKTILFTIREAIDTKNKEEKLISSTRNLKQGLGFTMMVKSGEQYQSAIVENLENGLLCMVPRDHFGNELRLPLRTILECFFISKTGQSYRLKTLTKKYISSSHQTNLLLSHTESIEALPNRKHNRKSIHTPCTFSHVTVANIVNGKHTEHKFYPNSKEYLGTIIDISAGGCSIQSENLLPVDEYLQIKGTLIAGSSDIIIGKVVKIKEQENALSSTMHVKFAKMPRASMNRIFKLIYIYGEATK